MSEPAAEGETRVAFGPVGLVGLALLLFALVRRRPGVAALAVAAVAADATVSALGGFAALRRRESATWRS